MVEEGPRSLVATWCQHGATLNPYQPSILPSSTPTFLIAHSHNLTQVDQLVFKQLVAKELPAVADHLEAAGADIACVFAQWFLCAFVNFMPLEVCLRVWDLLFFRKHVAVLFQVGCSTADVSICCCCLSDSGASGAPRCR